MISGQHIAAVSVTADPFFDTRRDQLVGLAARHAVSVIYQFRQYPAADGLMSYGVDLPDAYRHAGEYAGRILKGERPTDLSRFWSLTEIFELGHQPEDREGARSQHTVGRPRNRRRGDRMILWHAVFDGGKAPLRVIRTEPLLL